MEQRQLVYQYLSPEDMAPVFEIIEEDVEDHHEHAEGEHQEKGGKDE